MSKSIRSPRTTVSRLRDRLGDQEHPAHWHQGWLDKAKEDQRAIGANLAVIVSTALPDGIVEFGRIDGVRVAGLRAWPALAVALPEQVIQVAFAHAAAEGKHEKMECLYRYLVGDLQFYYDLLFDNPFGGVEVQSMGTIMQLISEQYPGIRPTTSLEEVVGWLNEFHARLAERLHRGEAVLDIVPE